MSAGDAGRRFAVPRPPGSRLPAVVAGGWLLFFAALAPAQPAQVRWRAPASAPRWFVAAAAAVADPLAGGKTAYAKGEYGRAIEEFQKAVQENQGDANAHLWLARALGRKAENVNRLHAAFLVGHIRREFERAVELDPQNLEARADLLEFYLEAPGAFGGGMDKARAEAEALRKLSAAEGHWAAARIAEKRKDYGRAEQELLAAAAAEPQRTGFYRDLGHFYHRRGRWAEMENAFRKAGDPKADFYLAAAYLDQGRNLEEAERLVKAFLAGPEPARGEEPTRAQGHQLLGQIYASLGRRESAEREYRAALAENPTLKIAREKLARLR